jgi:hypothetical protein
MTYIPDLSEYTYHRSAFYRPGTKAVGWLSADNEFDNAPPTEELLDLIWRYCKVSVAQMRGDHICEFCPSRLKSAHDRSSFLDALKQSASERYTERNGEKLWLGSAEIRAFGRDGVIYAAPTLIYHYVSVHHYKAPEEFLQALRSGPKPPDRAYFERLDRLNLQWRNSEAVESGGRENPPG